jgi:hypothetical protein
VKPGEIATCSGCGAQARATWSGQARPHQDGWPVLLTWTHGPQERCHVVTGEAPTLCGWCWERRQALGPDAPPLYRPAAGAELAPEAALPPPPPATRGQLSLL